MELRPKLLNYQQTSKRFQVQHLLEDRNNAKNDNNLQKLQEKIQKVKNFEKPNEEINLQKKGKLFDIFMENTQTDNGDIFNQNNGIENMKGVLKLVVEEKASEKVDDNKRNSFVNILSGTGY